MGGGVVFGISSIGKKLLEKLQRKSFRHAYLAQHVKRGIAYQIRALRDQRQWRQGNFAKILGKPQSVAHRLEDPDYGKYTLQTLLEIANVFDVALEVRFVSYSSFIRGTRDVSIPSMQVPSFNDDAGFTGLTITVPQISVSQHSQSFRRPASSGQLVFSFPVQLTTSSEVSEPMTFDLTTAESQPEPFLSYGGIIISASSGFGASLRVMLNYSCRWIPLREAAEQLCFPSE
jgi:transcriptional regulator with XRE-family HTH domain